MIVKEPQPQQPVQFMPVQTAAVVPGMQPVVMVPGAPVPFYHSQQPQQGNNCFHVTNK